MIDWTLYDAEKKRRIIGNSNLDPAQRRVIEEMVRTVLALPSSPEGRTWGEALGYGCASEVVVRIKEPSPLFPAVGSPLAVKVYRGRRPAFEQWHGQLFQRTPPLFGHP